MLRRHRRLAALAAAVGLAAIFLPVFAGIVMGHHATMSGTLNCAGTVGWSLQNWTDSNSNPTGKATNRYMHVRYSTDSTNGTNGTWSADLWSGTITAANYNSPITGSFTLTGYTSLWIQSYASGPWDDGAGGSSLGPWYSRITGPSNCATTTRTDIHSAAHAVVTTVPLGTTVHDSATVAGTAGVTPTGNVTFKWFTNGTCTGTAAATSSAFALSGGSVDATTFPQTPAAPGSYAFQAVYAGSGGTNPRYAGSTGACEPLTVTKIDSSTATEIHNAAHTVVISVPVGTSVHDKATVTGSGPTPTGAVTFKWFTNATCTNPAQATSSALTLSGGSVDATGFAQTPSPAGGFAFQATYSGDTNYNPSTGDCEPLTADKLASSTVTTIYNAAGAPVTSAPIGSQVTDSATVSGSGPMPTGTVDFTYFQNTTCSPTGSSAGTVSLNASGVASPSTAQTVGVNGGSFKAHYNGDAVYKPSDGACEPLTALKLDSSTSTDIHDADHNIVTSALIGSTVHDSATVTGSGPTPTGTVTFTVFPVATCVGVAGIPAGTVTLVNGVAHPSDTALVTSAGLAFKAHYNGDDTYNASDGACEPLTAIQLDSSTVTEIHDANHAVVTSVNVGTTVHDQATVSGSPYAVPTGTVTFSWYANGLCTGTPLASSGPLALSGGTVDATGFAQTPSPAGSYAFGSSYSGDANYKGSAGACEPLTVTKIDSSTLTTIHDAQEASVTSAPIWASVHDSAAVSGSGPTPTGTVAFTVYAGTTCSGEGASAGTIALVNGVAHPSSSSIVAPGGLSYIAQYSGDGIYYASTGDCEPLTAIKLDSSTRTDIHDANHGVITQAQIGTTVHDSATVTGNLAGGTPTGTVSFTIFANAICSGDGSSAGTVPLDASGLADPSNTAVVAAGGLSYRAHYNGSATYLPSDGTCEPLEALRLSSSTVTTIHDGNHGAITSAPVGATVHDSAVVSGSGPTPTGSVSFTVYQGTQCTGDGVSAGTVTLVNGVADPSNSSVVALGGLSYASSYSGDQNYDPSRGECEPLEATQLQSSTVTDIHDADHNVVTSAPIGSTVHDSATVSGSVGGPVPTGTVTFTVFAGTVCGGEGSSAGTVALDGSGVAHPSDPQVVPVGGLSFQAHYNGDDTYVASDGACEPLSATQVSSSTVTQIHDASHAVVTDVLIGTPVHDSAVVTGTGPTPTGTVTFAWFTNIACSGDPAATSGAFTLVNGSVDADGFVQTPAVAGGYAFQATYSGDATYGSSVGACEPLTAHDPTPTPTPTLPPPPTATPNHPTEPPFPSFTPTAPPPPTSTPAATPEPTPQPTLEPTPQPTPSGEVAGVTSKPHVTPPPTTTSGTGTGTGGTGLAAILALLVVAAGVILLVTPRGRRARR